MYSKGKIISSGNTLYASVYENIYDSKSVVKDTCINDGWVIWALFCLTKSSNFLPKIKLLEITLESGLVTAVTEKLTHNKKVAYRYNYFDIDKGIFPAKTSYFVKQSIESLIKEFIYGFAYEISFQEIDLGESNYMFRDNKEIVINDPFCDYISTDKVYNFIEKHDKLDKLKII